METFRALDILCKIEQRLIRSYRQGIGEFLTSEKKNLTKTLRSFPLRLCIIIICNKCNIIHSTRYFNKTDSIFCIKSLFLKEFYKDRGGYISVDFN